jgi:PEP-CTERM motif
MKIPIGKSILRSRALVVTLVLFAICAPSALAQTSTWSGPNGNWSAPGNWAGGVPVSTSNVVIGGATDPFGSPLLDVSATVNSLNLGMQSSITLTTLTSLTVNGKATLDGDTNVNEGTLTLNGAATNFNTMNLTTQTIPFNGHTITLGEGFVNGTGTLNNAGTIQGAGNISVALSNLGTIQATENNPLILSGNVNNGGVIQGTGGTIALDGGTVVGGIVQGSFSSDGGTITGAQLGTMNTELSTGRPFVLTSGSTLGIQGTVTNGGGVLLDTGSTLNGGGTATLVNSSGQAIQATGNNTFLGMNISNAGGLLLAGGAGLTLNGVSVDGGSLQGLFTTLNGTAVNNAQLGGTGRSFSLTDGSTLALQGNVTTGAALTLGNGVTLNGGGTAILSNVSGISGNGATLIGMNVNNVGTMTGAGAGITLNGVSVSGGILDGQFTPLNGTTVIGSQLGNGATSFTLPDGSTLALRGTILIGADSLSLGSGTTLNGGGETSLIRLGGSALTISGNGATLIGMNIDNGAAGTLTGTGAGLTLKAVSVNGGFLYGQFTTLNGTSITNAELGTAGTPFLLTAGSALTLEGTNTQNGQFINSGGTLLIARGTTLNNPTSISYVQTAGQTVVDGTIGIGGPAVHLQGGILSGTGAVNSGLVNVGGIVQPGDGGAPGTLFVTSYEQQSGATFDELIGSSGNGQLFAGAGSMTLDPGALLDIDLLNGFIPTDGETFEIMEAFKLSGTFANAPATGFQMDGFNWTIAYNANDVVLDAVSAVNGGGSGGGTTVPEPSSFLLLLGGVVALFAGVNWRNRMRAAC